MNRLEAVAMNTFHGYTVWTCKPRACRDALRAMPKLPAKRLERMAQESCQHHTCAFCGETLDWPSDA